MAHVVMAHVVMAYTAIGQTAIKTREVFMAWAGSYGLYSHRPDGYKERKSEARLPARTIDPRSHGLHIHGLYSHGLDSYGQYSHGPCSYRPDSYKDE